MDPQRPENVFEKKVIPDDPLAKQQELPQPASPSISTVRYIRWDHSTTLVCNDCGSLVQAVFVDAHDEFHAQVES